MSVGKNLKNDSVILWCINYVYKLYINVYPCIIKYEFSTYYCPNPN